VPCRNPPTHHGHARRRHRDHERRPLALAGHRPTRADVDLLGKWDAGVHADLAAHDNTRIRLVEQAQRNPLVGVLAETIADGRATRRKGQETTGLSQPVPVLDRRRDVVRRWIPPLHGIENAQRNQVPVGGSMGHVAGRGKDRRGKGMSHSTQVIGALRHEKRQGHAFSIGVGRRQHSILPCRVKVAIVPVTIIIHHGVGGRMRRQIIDPTFANHPNFATITQAVSILSSGANDNPPAVVRRPPMTWWYSSIS
jgi:hypothetical protein